MITMSIESNQIKKEVEEFFQKMTYQPKIEVSFEKNNVFVNLTIETPQILIGEGGETLAKIQHLLKIILRKKIQEIYHLDLDINDYKKKKNQRLKEMTKFIADEVSLTKKEKYLPPMLAYERRMVHLEIADRQDVNSESMGVEPERKILISPS